jgi:tryptophan-rich hypothetical protein
MTQQMPKQVARLQSTKWTSAVVVEGWRHFEVVGVVLGEGGWWVELAASCDRSRRVQVNARHLLQSVGWTPGWATLEALQQVKEP